MSKIRRFFTWWGSFGGGPGVGVDNILLEDGSNLLTETGDTFLLE